MKKAIAYLILTPVAIPMAALILFVVLTNFVMSWAIQEVTQ